MTDPRPLVGSAQRRLDRLVLLARGALIWEVAWRAVAALLAAAALFVTLAWFGLLMDRPPAVRIGVLLGCLAFGLATIWWGLRGGGFAALRPGRRAALARIDRDSGFRPGQASAAEDTLANSGDAASAALWRLHQARLANNVKIARVGVPRPHLARFDGVALRAAILLLFIAAAAVAGSERTSRLASAFDWGGPAAGKAAAVRIDAWIDPPGYTGKPPIVLSAKLGEDANVSITAPTGSAIVVRASDPAAIDVTTQGAIVAKAPEENSRPDGARRFVLRGDGTISFPRPEGGRAAFAIVAIPDKPPTIVLTGPPKPNARASLTLAYRLADDYGVVSAEADFSAPEIDGAPVTSRTLVAPPRIGLALPVGQNGLGDATTTSDLSDHPWAGARATLVLHAHDEGGNEGASEPTIVQLPQRRFAKPLARALVEQRRNLVLDPDHRERVASALTGLMIAPESFGTAAGVYLGLRVAAQRLSLARTDPALLEVADYLWQMALQIEEGDLSEAERDLRAAQKDLREALQRGAPEEDIKKLTQNLRAAMDKFLNEMAQRQARENAEHADEPALRGNRNSRTVSRDDLKAMMDRMEEMARSGDLADAQRMLEQMQNILENLRTAKRTRRNPRAQEMSRALDDLDALTREQQALRDDTFREPSKGSRKGKRPGAQQQNGQPQDGGADQGTDDADSAGADDDGPQAGAQQHALQQRQKALREKLADLQRRMEKMRKKGGDDKLGDADGAMKDAENALDNGEEGQQAGDGQQPGPGNKGQGGKGQGGKSQGGKSRQGGGREAAVDAQGRALQALRDGAQNLAQQMQGQGQGQGQGEGQGDDATADGDSDDGDGDPESGQPRQAEGDSQDPLGRPTSRDPLYNPRARYDPLGVSPALRAQRVLEELRRRLGDTSRPQDEVDYLERLLRRY